MCHRRTGLKIVQLPFTLSARVIRLSLPMYCLQKCKILMWNNGGNLSRETDWIENHSPFLKWICASNGNIFLNNVNELKF